MQTADSERFWWDTLDDDEALKNTAGWPPYDAVKVAQEVCGQIAPRHHLVRILDLGCGAGRLTREVAQLMPEAEIIGVDIAPSMLDRARKVCPGNVVFRVGDGRHLPDHMGMLDGAYSVTVFQHIPHDAQESYIHQVSAALRPGARFVFTVSLGNIIAPLQHQASVRQVDGWCAAADLEVLGSWLDDTGWHWYTTERNTP